MSDIDRLLQKINEGLRVGRMGLQLELRGVDQWISVRGTFPSKPGSPKVSPHQQRIPLGLRATKENLLQAEKLARQLRVDLDSNQFDWSKWMICDEDSNSLYFTQSLIDRLKASYFIDTPETLSTLTTWHKSYNLVYKKFPENKPINKDSIIDWIKAAKSGGNRAKTTSAARHLCKVLQIKFDFAEEIKSERRSFKRKMLTPVDLPTDQQILETYNSIEDPGWQWVFGLMAAYGLRNHEVVGLDFSRYPDLIVRDTAKTGKRIVIPIYSEWAELWNLEDGHLPERNDWSLTQSNATLGKKISDWFAVNGIPFNPYALRHCYAVRTVRFMDERKAAKLMGHSVLVHQQTYQFWADEEIYVNAAKQEIENKKGLVKVPGVN